MALKDTKSSKHHKRHQKACMACHLKWSWPSHDLVMAKPSHDHEPYHPKSPRPNLCSKLLLVKLGFRRLHFGGRKMRFFLFLSTHLMHSQHPFFDKVIDFTGLLWVTNVHLRTMEHEIGILFEVSSVIMATIGVIPCRED